MPEEHESIPFSTEDTTPVGDMPVRSLRYKDLTIEGFSRAAVQTYWRVPEFRLGFDLGAQPWSFMGTPTWFVSHTHLDHVAALPAYVARRRMMRMEPPTIYLPASAVEPVRRLLKVISRLDRGRLPCELVGVQPGEEYDLSRELVVTVVPTMHTVPSVGYIVWHRRHKLKPEFHGLPGEKVRDLKFSGVEITREIRVPRIAYLGDSLIDALDETPAMYEAEVLILELTFVAPRHRREKIRKFGHIHLDDVIAQRERFKNAVIIGSHLSTRYHTQQVQRYVQRALPDMLDGRLHLWL